MTGRRHAPTRPPTVFTLEAVNALVPRLKALMAAQLERRPSIERAARDASRSSSGTVPQTSSPLEAGDPAAGADPQGETWPSASSDYQSAWREVEDMGAVLKDPRMGLVDFYGAGRRQARLALLAATARTP